MTEKSPLSVDIIEKALIAFCTERSAQCGEPWYPESWEEFKVTAPELYEEEIAQMQCALEAAGLQDLLSEIHKLREALENSRNSHTYEAQTAIQRAQRAELKKDMDVLYYRAKSFERLQNECLEALASSAKYAKEGV